MFSLLDSVDMLCTALQCSPSYLHEAVVRQRLYCNPLVIPRRRASTKPRTVWSVADPVRRLQRQVALWLRPAADAQGIHVTGFRDDSTPFKNASQHIGAFGQEAEEEVLTADLSNFFGTIDTGDVMKVFEDLGAKRPASTILARLCTIDERLMQGGRASAPISNLVGDRLDRIILAELAPACVYTRYVDDLTISGPTIAMPSLAQLTHWVGRARFRLRPDSVIRKPRCGGPIVTGLNVGGREPRVPRRLRRQIERFLRFSKKFDQATAAARTFKNGRRTDAAEARNYIRSVAHWIRPIDTPLADSWDEKLGLLE